MFLFLEKTVSKLYVNSYIYDFVYFVGYTRFQIGCVFVEYDLFKPTTFIQNCIYEFSDNFDTCYISISRDRNIRKMSYMYRSSPEILRYHPIPPFHFSFTVPSNIICQGQMLT